MKTKEAIKLLKTIINVRKMYSEYPSKIPKEKPKVVRDIEKIIELLKRGEKYEQVYKKVKTIICSHNLIWLEKKMLSLEQKHSLKLQPYNEICEELKEFHEKLLEKYFPKEELTQE